MLFILLLFIVTIIYDIFPYNNLFQVREKLRPENSRLLP